jgi:hypothetical protein
LSDLTRCLRLLRLCERENRDLQCESCTFGRVVLRASKRDVSWNDDHCRATLGNGGPNCARENLGQLFRIRNQLDVIAAFPEKRFRVGCLKVVDTDFDTGYVRTDGETGTRLW